MNSRGQGKGAIVGLLVIIVLAGFFIVRQIIPTKSRPLDVDWACEQCDHMFTAPEQLDNRDCPQCGGEAVRSYIYYDTAKGELVELYREKTMPGLDPDMLIGQEHRLIKVPGGEWMRIDYNIQFQYGFPVRVANPEALEYAPPGSEHR